MNNKQIINFFEQLSNEDFQGKLTIFGMESIINNSTFSRDVKMRLLELINKHRHCELDDLEVDPFVIEKCGTINTSLKCESCYNVILDTQLLESILSSK